MTIDKRILNYRAKHDMTQDEIAKKLGVSRGLINKLENGKLKPSKMVIVKMELLERGDK